jgi:HSP20 family protein
MEKEILAEKNKEHSEKYSEKKSMRCVVPVANLITLEKGFEIEIELPGVSINNVDISLTEDDLKVSAMRPAIEYSEYRGPFLPSIKFIRNFSLGRSEIDREGIAAKAYNGLLKIFIPKSLSTQPRKISITPN